MTTISFEDTVFHLSVRIVLVVLVVVMVLRTQVIISN